jgi:hypothetical protein
MTQSWNERADAMKAAQRMRDRAKSSQYKGGPPTIRNAKGQEMTTGGRRIFKFGENSSAPTITRIKTSKETKGDTTTVTHKRVTTDTSGKTKKQAVKAAAERRAKFRSANVDVQNSQETANYRESRKRRGDFKGKFYGPDAFKGDMNVLKAWRMAGSPKDTKAFASKAKGD